MEDRKESIQTDRGLLTETLVVIIVTIALFLVLPSLKSFVSAIPAAYLLIERRIRRRTWTDAGFKLKNTFSDIKKNWIWILLVGVVSPLLTFFSAKYLIPGFLDHVVSRVPLDVKVIVPALITITIGTFLEEIIFRGFIQARFEQCFRASIAIAIASILFAFMHYTPGSFNIVASDITGVFIDSIIYGIIFTRTKNIFASWIGHYLSDLVGIVCLLYFL